MIFFQYGCEPILIQRILIVLDKIFSRGWDWETRTPHPPAKKLMILKLILCAGGEATSIPIRNFMIVSPGLLLSNYVLLTSN